MTSENSAPDVAKTARSWWQQLQRTPNRRGDPGALARLRRCATPTDAMAEPATLELFRRLGRARYDDLPRVAVIAIVLAHVRDDAGPGRSAIQAVGRTPERAEPKLSPLRFRRLLACREEDELVREMRRFVAIAGETVNVGDLAESLFFWGDPVRTNWAFYYYGAGYAAPVSASEDPSS